jgi:hypothetical protein
LQAIAEIERILMVREQLLGDWLKVRTMLAATPREQQAVHRKATLAVLARLADDPDLVETIDDEAKRQAILADLDGYRRYLTRLQEAQAGARPPRPK